MCLGYYTVYSRFMNKHTLSIMRHKCAVCTVLVGAVVLVYLYLMRHRISSYISEIKDLTTRKRQLLLNHDSRPQSRLLIKLAFAAKYDGEIFLLANRFKYS